MLNNFHSCLLSVLLIDLTYLEQIRKLLFLETMKNFAMMYFMY